MEDLQVRRATFQDMQQISLLVDDPKPLTERFGNLDIGALINHSFLSVVALDANEIVAFAAFNDYPEVSEISASNWMSAFKQNFPSVPLSLYNCTWVRFFVANKLYEADAGTALLKTVFATVPALNFAMSILPAGVEPFAPLVDFFEPLATGDESEGAEQLFLCKRDLLIPSLDVRKAQVEDFDDLMPVFQAQGESVQSTFGDFFLAELIESQDENNMTLVGEVNDRAVGLMSFTAEVDIELLQKCFDLSLCDDLIKVEIPKPTPHEPGDWSIYFTAERREEGKRHWAEFEESFKGLIGSEPKYLPGDSSTPVVEFSRVMTLLTELGKKWQYVSISAEESKRRQRNAALSGEPISTEDEDDFGRDIVKATGCGMCATPYPEPPKVETEEGEEEKAAVVPETPFPPGELVIGWETLSKAIQLSLKLRPEQQRRLQFWKWLEHASDQDPVGFGLSFLRTAFEEAQEPMEEEVIPEEEEKEEKGEEEEEEKVHDEEKMEEKDGEDGEEAEEEVEEDLVEVEDAQASVAALPALLRQLKLVGAQMDNPCPLPFSDMVAASLRLSDLAPVPEAGLEQSSMIEEAAVVWSELEVEWKQFCCRLRRVRENQEKGMVVAPAPKIVIVGPTCSGRKTAARGCADSIGDGLTVIDAEDLDKSLFERLCLGDCIDGGWVVTGNASTVQKFSQTIGSVFEPTAVIHLEVEDDLVFQRSVQVADDTGMEMVDPLEEAEVFQKRLNVEREAIAQALEEFPLLVTQANGGDAEVDVIDFCSSLLLQQWENYLQQIRSCNVIVEEEEPEPNAFAVTLFCLDESLHCRTRDLLEKAFMVFQGYDYCIITLPHSAPESALLEYFTHVTPSATSTFDHVLYVCHRDALFSPADMVIRHATLDDLPSVMTLCGLRSTLLEEEDDEEVKKIIPDAVNAIRYALSEEGMGLDAGGIEGNPMSCPVIATVDGQAVALCVMDRVETVADKMDIIRGYYDVDSIVDASFHSPLHQGFIKQLMVHPVFLHVTRFILRHAMKLYSKSILYAWCNEATPNLREHMVPISPMLPPQEKEEPAVPGNGSALFILPRFMVSQPKVRVNSRVVVVGASTTGLSCLKTLLSIPYLQFSHLTLLTADPLLMDSDLGLPTDLLRQVVHGMSIPDQVRVVYGKMEEIDREEKVILIREGISNGNPLPLPHLPPAQTVLPYDVLFLASGLTEATLPRLKLDSTVCLPANPMESYTTDSGTSEDIWNEEVMMNHMHGVRSLSSQQRLIDAVKGRRVCDLANVVVYGRGIEALAVVQWLLSEDVPASSIAFVKPTEEDEGFVASDVDDVIMEGLLSSGVAITHGKYLRGVGNAEGAARGKLRVISVDTDEEEMLELPCTMLVCADRPVVPSSTFAAVNDCGLVFDHRLVVDHMFLTSDQHIFAAGPFAKFSGRYGLPFLHQQASSVEIGRLVGEVLLKRIDPLSSSPQEIIPDEIWEEILADPPMGEPADLPEFAEPKTSMSVLPGNKFLFHSQLPDCFCKGGTCRDLTTRSPELELCKIKLNAFGNIASILCLTNDMPVPALNFQRLLGLHQSFLHSLMYRYDQGEIQDLLAYLRQDWMMALFHQKFGVLVKELHKDLRDDAAVVDLVSTMIDKLQESIPLDQVAAAAHMAVGVGGSALPADTRKVIQTQVFAWIKHHKHVLKRYFVPETEEI